MPKLREDASSVSLIQPYITIHTLLYLSKPYLLFPLFPKKGRKAPNLPAFFGVIPRWFPLVQPRENPRPGRCASDPQLRVIKLDLPISPDSVKIPFIMKKLILSLLVLSSLLSGCATLKTHSTGKLDSVPQLQAELDKLFNDPGLKHAFWGVEVRSLKTNDTLYDMNAQKSFRPASNMKVYTTSAALDYLGPDYHYYTHLRGNPQLQGDGVLTGDLVVQGSGDPSFSGRYSRGSTSSIAMMQELVDTLKLKGIKTISGNIVGDDNVFDERYYPGSWMWGYNASGFAAQQSGLCFNDDVVEVYATPGTQAGDAAKVWLTFPTNYVTIISKVTTAEKGKSNSLNMDRDWYSNIVTVTGQVALDSNTTKEWVTVNNPTLFFTTVLYERLTASGIQVMGTPKDIDDYTPDTTQSVILATHESYPLSRIIRIINKVSQNFYAEQLVKTLGKEVLHEGSTYKGTEAVENFMKKLNVDIAPLYIVDGCGLSSMNLVTPDSMIEVLKYMHQHKDFKTFYDSLPIAGVDGTITRRMKGTNALNNVRAKTGFIGHTRTLSGYVNTKDGEPLAFSMMCNNYTVPTSEVEELQDAACVFMAEFSRQHGTK